MIDSDEKKYVAELCSSLYGFYPRDVIPYQGLFRQNSAEKGYFFVKFTTSDAKNDHQTYFEFKCCGYVTDDSFATVINNQNWYGTDFLRYFMCDEIVLKGGSNASGYVVGYQCV